MQTESLKAAIVRESYEDRAGREVISVKSALDIIDRLAAEQQKDGEWHLCKDEKPEFAGFGKLYWITAVYRATGLRMTRKAYWHGKWAWQNGKDITESWQVVAWRPYTVPEAYREKGAAE